MPDTHRTAVLDIVGLTRSLLGTDTPFLKKWVEKNGAANFKPAFPALTTTAQSSYLTGESEGAHGIVGNGWYDREGAEVKFWKQSNHLVRGEKIWEKIRRERPDFTVAKMFWWYNMYSSADFSATPRPLYGADGKKTFDIHTQPMSLREDLKKDLGDFPFPSFWGPMSGIPASKWIAASARWIEEKEKPDLNLVYLPHLDYCLQKFVPGAPEIAPQLRAIDAVCEELITFLEARGVRVLALSEYGISKVDQAIHLNRIFREKGWLQVKDEVGRETLDCGGCDVFAVADHQIAHVYVNNPAIADDVRELVKNTPGVEEIREAADLWPDENSPGRQRGGDFVAVAAENAWFTYYYWLDDAKAPDFARAIDIHRKPGYDPVELFINPDIKFPKLKMAAFLLRKKLGFRTLMDIIPLDAGLVQGSHGRDKVRPEEQPLAIGPGAEKISKAEDVAGWIEETCLREN